MSETILEQTPFGITEFADNPENCCAVVLVLDTSGSMNGRPIDELNEGLQTFRDELMADFFSRQKGGSRRRNVWSRSGSDRLQHDPKLCCSAPIDHWGYSDGRCR